MLLYYIAMSFLSGPKSAPNQPFDIVITVPGSKDGTPGNSTIQIGNGVEIPIGNINNPTQENVKQAIESFTTQLNTINQNPTVVSLNGVKSALASLKPLCVAYNGDTEKLKFITAANNAVIAATTGGDMGDITSLTTALTTAIATASTVKKSILTTSPTTKAIKDFDVKIDELVKQINTQIAKAQTAAATGASEKATDNKALDNNAPPAASQKLVPVREFAESKNATENQGDDNVEFSNATENQGDDNDEFSNATEKKVDGSGVNEDAAAEKMRLDEEERLRKAEEDVAAKQLAEKNASALDAAALDAGTKGGGSRPKNTRKRRRNKRNRKTAYRRRY